MAHTTVIAPPPGSSLVQRFVAICTAIAFAERVRSMGDHALVVLDDITCMVRMQLMAGSRASLAGRHGTCAA